MLLAFPGQPLASSRAQTERRPHSACHTVPPSSRSSAFPATLQSPNITPASHLSHTTSCKASRRSAVATWCRGAWFHTGSTSECIIEYGSYSSLNTLMHRTCVRDEGPHLWEEHDVGLEQRNGNVPGAVCLSEEADELRGDLGLGLAQGNTLQQCLRAWTWPS